MNESALVLSQFCSYLGFLLLAKNLLFIVSSRVQVALKYFRSCLQFT